MILHFNLIDYINYYILSYFNGHRIMWIWLINLSALKWMLYQNISFVTGKRSLPQVLQVVA